MPHIRYSLSVAAAAYRSLYRLTDFSQRAATLVGTREYIRASDDRGEPGKGTTDTKGDRGLGCLREQKVPVMFADILYVWSASPALSVAIWLVLLITLLYLGRPHAHQLLRSTGRAIFAAMRIAATSIRHLEERVAERNRDVLLAMGREAAEKAIEREFTRVKAIVDRDLGQYPTLHRKLSDTVQRIEEDYQASAEEAPLPPAWSEVVDTISALPTSGDPTVVKVLNNIKSAVESSHQQTLRAYQKSANERHRVLSGMRPEWRTLNRTMDKVQQTITGLEDRAKTIDRQMAEYESLRKAEDKAVNALTS